MHSTDKMDDGYVGSGKRLWFSINYHGKENHSKEILEYYDTRDELKKREAEIVNEQLLTEELCMNLTTGGGGGNGFWSEEHKQAFITSDGPKNFVNRMKVDKVFGDKIKSTLLDNVKKAHINGNVKYDNFKGKKHSDETKKKMSESSKGTGTGKANSQYGSCWITNGTENKKIKKEDLETYVSDGWERGRKLK